MRSVLLLPITAYFIAGFLVGCRGQVSSKPPIHPNPNMDQQKRYDPQEPSKFFRDKRAMRSLVTGTVSRSPRKLRKTDNHFLMANDHLYRGKVKGLYAETLPKEIRLSAQLLAKGKERYGIYCTPCHGATGNGKGIISLFHTKSLIPRNLHQVKNLKVGQLYEAILKGKGTMVSYSSRLNVKERWAVVAYIRALQLSRIPPQSR